MLDVAVVAVHRRVTAVAKKGLLAFLDPAGISVGTVDDLGLLVLAIHLLARPGRAGDDGGAARALHLQAALLKLAIDQCQQFLIQLGLDQAVAEAANSAGVGLLAGGRFKVGEDHKVLPYTQGLFQLSIRQAVHWPSSISLNMPRGA